MANTPLQKKVYHPLCGRSYYYALVSKRYNKEVAGKILRVKVYMCRHCAEEFSDLDIMEHEANTPHVDITAMSDEERKAFIADLFKKKKEQDAKPS
jgi:hypothetical protein